MFNEVASRYARALYSLSLDNKKLEEVEKQAKEILDVLNASDDLIALLSNEFLSIEERQGVARQVLKGVDDDILAMIDIIIKRL